MGKTLGVNAKPVTCFRGAGALGSAAEKSYGEGYQIIEIFAEKSPSLFGCSTGLATKFDAKRVSLLVKRAGSLTKSVGNTINCFTEIALAKRLIDLAGNSLRRLTGSFCGLIPQLTCLTQYAVKCSLSLAPGGCASGGCAAVIVQLARPFTNRQNTEQHYGAVYGLNQPKSRLSNRHQLEQGGVDLTLASPMYKLVLKPCDEIRRG